MIRRQIALELGTVVPIIRLRDNIQLNPNQYIIKIKGIQVSEGEILFDHYMAMNSGICGHEFLEKRLFYSTLFLHMLLLPNLIFSVCTYLI